MTPQKHKPILEEGCTFFGGPGKTTMMAGGGENTPWRRLKEWPAEPLGTAPGKPPVRSRIEIDDDDDDDDDDDVDDDDNVDDDGKDDDDDNDDDDHHDYFGDDDH